ncbi:RHS repeat-associated core domain-containing protein [Kallotenue papyrolyticum]|uniref:RHS repeat-associated core domain-containing protein n=1 Tax=Kallotenue papyrolyticum TaxID=1325125 RepID=UPI0004929862|nr:RHS repeat-associated core domain-containing protein [Kallotenue papyrolyticum]
MGRWQRWSAWLTVVFIASVALPGAQPAARASATVSAQRAPEQPPSPPLRQVAPLSDPMLPSLVIDVQANPDPIALGEPLTISVAILNQAQVAAQQVEISLPVPAHSRPAANAALQSDGRAWHWTIAELPGGATATLTATLTLDRVPASGAVVLRPTVHAQRLTMPVQAVGGALVLPEDGLASRFVPGQAGRLRSADGRIEVELPARAARRALQLRQRWRAPAGERVPPGQRRLLPPFFLNAEDERGQAVHRFDQPLTLRVRYSDEQVLVRGWDESALALFWFDDEGTQQWMPIPAQVDAERNEITAQVDHFSAFTIGDLASPSTAFVPSLKAWQVGLFSGSATYSYPLELPAGPAGVKPNLTLSYTSNAIDGDSGMHQVFQAGWAGLGWSLETGAVARNSIVINPTTGAMFDTFTIVVNGQSHQLVRAEPLVTQPDEHNPTHWAWRPTDETYIRVRAVPNGASWDGNPGRGGLVNGVWQPRYTWVLWAKDGTRYEFAEDLWYGWDRCAVANEAEFEAYKWLLTRVIDPHGNIISYTYARNTWTGGEVRCDPWRYARGTVDRDAWPVLVEWGAHAGSGTPARYRLEFVSTAREQDTQFDGADNQYGGKLNGAPRQTRRLLALRVFSNPSGNAWELLREYRLSTDYSLSPDRVVNGQPDRANPKLTLKAIQVIASDGSSALPAMTFGYGSTPDVSADACTGTSWPRGDWNRLTQVENGYGGRVTFTYEQIGVASCKRIFRNHRRITSKTVSDGRGNSFTWTYRYSNPAMNSLGWRLTGRDDPNATQEYPNSAVLFYNTYWDALHNNQHWLATRPLKEFRGHGLVVETDPYGWQTEHWFYQGDVGCVPTTGGDAILNDACFQHLRDREVLKGREYKTMLRTPAASGSHWLKETQQSYTVTFLDYSHAPLTGLWRAWHAATETRELAWEAMEGLTNPVVKTTRYLYDDEGIAYINGSTTGSNARYGNLGRVEEYDQRGTRVRITKYYYAIRDDATSYLADRVWATVVFDTTWQVLAYTAQFYDDASDPRVMGRRGLLTRVSRLYAAGASGALGDTLSSADTTYAYDAYGNRTRVTTYADAGSSWISNGLRVWGTPGNGSAARTTTTDYDAIFHAFPVRVTNALGHVEQADYDWRMGTLTRVTDANQAVTQAAYDGFGRLIGIARPGDTLGQPTQWAIYDDWAQPMRITVAAREQSGQSHSRPTVLFYDGLGQLIQSKRESNDGQQQIVTDTRYDALGRTIATSQPRYVDHSQATPFWEYVTPGSEVRWTTTSYDGLGRTLRVTHPDGSFVGYHYGIYEGLVFHDVADQNRHRTYAMYDSLGRRVKVRELSGDCSPPSWGYPWHWPEYACGGSFTTTWADDATTTYSYSPLDLLTQVTDAKGNVTTISYDALGRKIEMRDPDMGTWRYRYDANGNLIEQTDAKGQTITFRYDALDRLTAKTASDGRASTYTYDEAFGSGTGRRTSMRTSLNGAQQSSSSFWYDARGRTTARSFTIAGLAGVREMRWSYDAADRVTAITYPSGETVSYTYDAAWRQTSACSSLGVCYASNASYTALDQPIQLTFGNGLLQRWDYTSPMQRVQQIRVGPSSNPGLHFNRSYTYESNGNVATIRDGLVGQTQHFRYDHRDRLTRAWTSESTSNAYDHSYTYDAIGNLTSKAGVSYSYGSNGNGTGAGPHQARTVGGQAYTYDAVGNLLSGGGRTYTWQADNLPASISSGGATETYTYDADGARLTRTAGGVTTVYVGGLYEEDLGSSGTRALYQFNGQIIAQRSSDSGGLIYLHGDHLGSVSLATNASGAVVSRQDFDPWGSIRSGGISQTALNYTGQRKDGTGLLYYHARYYDPVLARFISADSVVPGAPDGSMDGVALTPLTVDFHETGFVTELNAENRQGFWFQLTQTQRQEANAPWGPQNPQALNRYAYVQNNPLRYTDPTGHAPLALGLVFFVPGVGQAALLAVGAVVLVGSAVLLVDAGVKIYRKHHHVVQPIPGRPFRGRNAPEQAYGHLEKYHGVDRKTARNRLHKLKEQAGLAPDDDVVIGRTGDVYDERTGERIGSLTDPSLGKER